MAGEHLGDERADAAAADDDGIDLFGRRHHGEHRVRLLLGGDLARRAGGRDSRPARDQRHGERGDGEHDRARLSLDDALGDGEADDDEGELTAGAEQQRGLDGRRPRQRGTGAAAPISTPDLMTISPTMPAMIATGCAASIAMSRPMPTEKKNTPSSSPLNGSIVASMAR